jgi:NAD(P)-dependent dehydrogenase (short-subunit alcohol dehydrogenase family)
MDLRDKRIIVVGAGSGIGRSVAVAASRAGASVILAGRKRDALEQTAALASGPAHVNAIDATNEAEVEAFFAGTGAFDHLVSTISQGATGPVSELSAFDVQRAMNAKLWAPFFLVKHGKPHINAAGSFTFFSGIRGARPAPRSSITSLVNGGLEAFAKAMAVELGPIRVNVISPGIVDSGPSFWSALGDEARERMFSDFAQRSPARRVGLPDEQADAVLFAIANPFLTGAVIPIDGGALLM